MARIFLVDVALLLVKPKFVKLGKIVEKPNLTIKKPIDNWRQQLLLGSKQTVLKGLGLK